MTNPTVLHLIGAAIVIGAVSALAAVGVISGDVALGVIGTFGGAVVGTTASGVGASNVTPTPVVQPSPVPSLARITDRP